jgi:hypothetical protein
MSWVRTRVAVVTAVVVAMLSPGLLGAPSVSAAGGSQITLNTLYVLSSPNGSSGGTTPVTIHLATTGGKDLRVGFTENEVAGTGDQWRAAAWNAATVATLLTGAPLGGRQVTFDLNGRIDGPSAGALMTIGVLALMRGDPVKKDITMTGTINPDGTVGPVGGIPYKLDGVTQAKKTRMLIPAGERNSADDSGRLVDVVGLGSQKGIQVTEVADIYEAYKAFTGKTLPRPGPEGTVRLSGLAYDKVKALTGGWLADFQSSAGQFNSLDPQIQLLLASISSKANKLASDGQALSNQGLQAGAYSDALQAAAIAKAAVFAGRGLQTYLTQGLGPFVQQVQASASISGKVDALFGDLKTNRPATVSQAGALISAYSGGIDALNLADFGNRTLQAATQAATPDVALTDAFEGAVYYEFAGTLVDAAKQLVEAGTSTGAKLNPSVNTKQVADFFRRAAIANLTAFETLFVAAQANKAGISTDRVRTALAGADTEYALALAGQNIVGSPSLDRSLGGGSNAAFGELGGSESLFVRSASLLAKYYGLSLSLNANFEATGTNNEQALVSALGLGKSQVERSVAQLQGHKVDATLQVGDYEAAGVLREGDLSSKLDALSDYLDAFVTSRILAYLGGFEKIS